MTRLIAGLTVLIVAALGGTTVWAQQADPFHFGYSTPAALEGGFNAGAGKIAFLALAAPRACADGSDTNLCPRKARAFFYDAACNRVTDRILSLSENGSTVLAVPATGPGNVLVAKSEPTAAALVGADFSSQSVLIGWLLSIDLNRGIASLDDLAIVDGDFGSGWNPYKPAAVVPFLPADSGNFLVTLTFRCPVGVSLVDPTTVNTLFGSPFTLGGDMLEAYSTGSRNRPINESYGSGTSTIVASQIFDAAYDVDSSVAAPSNFATTVTVNFFDVNENPLGTANVACQCRSEPRTSQLLAAAGAQAVYLEIAGSAPANFTGRTGGAFTGSWNVQVQGLFGGLNLNFSDRFWGAGSTQLLGPTF